MTSASAQTFEVDTPAGPGRWLIHGSSQAGILVAMAPGHSGKVDAADLTALAQRANDQVSVALWTPPFVVAGRRSGAPPATLDAAWLVAAPALRAHLPHHTRFVQGGHSAGARMACRTAKRCGADAVLACSFPLHPPGRPTSSRAAELLEAGVPTLVIQGTKDTFGTAQHLADLLADDQVIGIYQVAGAGHDLVPAKRADPDGLALSGAIDFAWDWIAVPGVEARGLLPQGE